MRIRDWTLRLWVFWIIWTSRGALIWLLGSKANGCWLRWCLCSLTRNFKPVKKLSYARHSPVRSITSSLKDTISETIHCNFAHVSNHSVFKAYSGYIKDNKNHWVLPSCAILQLGPSKGWRGWSRQIFFLRIWSHRISSWRREGIKGIGFGVRLDFILCIGISTIQSSTFRLWPRMQVSKLIRSSWSFTHLPLCLPKPLLCNLLQLLIATSDPLEDSKAFLTSSKLRTITVFVWLASSAFSFSLRKMVH